jgi:hypothetical protein
MDALGAVAEWVQLYLISICFVGVFQAGQPWQGRTTPAFELGFELCPLTDDPSPEIDPFWTIGVVVRIEIRTTFPTKMLNASFPAVTDFYVSCGFTSQQIKGTALNPSGHSECGTGEFLAIRAMTYAYMIWIEFSFKCNFTTITFSIDFHCYPI